MPVLTLGDLKTRVYNRLDQNTALYPDADVTREINDSIAAWSLFTSAIQAQVHVPGYTVANQVLYSVPAGILVPQRVYFEGRQLAKESIRKMSLLRRDWITDVSSTRGPVCDWIPFGIGTFAIHPADSIGGNDLLVVGIAEPTPLVLDADPITLPDEDADSIAELSSANLTFREGGAIFAASSLLYQKFLSRMKERMTWKAVKLPRYWILAATQAQYYQARQQAQEEAAG
jgi:hypothetical protein